MTDSQTPDMREQLRQKLADRIASDRTDSHHAVIVPIRTEGTRPVLVCAAGGGAGVPSYRKLAELLPADQPVVAIQVRGLQSENLGSRSIESMAEQQLSVLLAAWPTGPYCLCGHSLGGTVALEMAQRLIQAGHEVRKLIIIDQPGPDIRIGLWHWFYWQWIAITELPWRLRFEYVWSGIRFRLRSNRLLPNSVRKLFISKSKRLKPAAAQSNQSRSELRLAVMESSLKALNQYRPREYVSDMVLIRAKSSAPRLNADASGGWKTVSRGMIKVHDIPGHHMNIFESPNIEVFADCLIDCLDLRSTTTPIPTAHACDTQIL